jgi:hypothetical protein
VLMEGLLEIYVLQYSHRLHGIGRLAQWQGA